MTYIYERDKIEKEPIILIVLMIIMGVISVYLSREAWNIIIEKIPEIKEIKLIKENEDGTKQYVLESEKDVDLRKIVFNEFAKENITIFEMKKADTTLEDAFMKLIEGGEK